MPNHSHPLDQEIDQMRETETAAIRLFSRDGIVEDAERVLLSRIANHRQDVSAYRLRQIAAGRFEHNGLSRVAREGFEDAGFRLVPTAAECRPANVIVFRGNEPQGAA